MFGKSGPSLAHDGDERFRLLVESIEDYAIYMLDCGGHMVTWNRGAERNKGYTAREVLGRHFRMFFVPEDIAALVPEKELEEALSKGRCMGEGWRLRKNGERFWASFVITAILDANGRLNGFAKVTRDLTERKQHEDAMLALESALRDERNTFHAAAESSMDSLYICEALRDAKGEIEDFVFTYLNSSVERMTSIPRSVMQGAKMLSIFPGERALRFFEMYRQVVFTTEPLALEFPLEENDDNGPWVRMQAVKLRDGIAITVSDITHRKLNDARILHMAHHDHLTSLPNRSLLSDRIGQAIGMANRYGHKVGVFLIDLDAFKHINDTLGHAAGDSVLVTVAVRLKAAIRATDSVIRIGGDEFIVVMPEISTLADTLICGDKILASLQQSIDIEGEPVRVTCSIGIAIYPDNGLTVDELISHADSAMYEAKHHGKNQLEVFVA